MKAETKEKPARKIPKRLNGSGSVVKIGKQKENSLKLQDSKLHWWRSNGVEFFGFLALLALNCYLVSPFWKNEFDVLFSAPLIPALAKIAAFAFSLPFKTAVSRVILTFYVLSPLTFYLLVKEVTKRLLPSVFAALLFSSPIFKSRLLLAFYGDGAHLAALTLIPLTGYLVLKFLKSDSYFLGIITALAIAAIALSSPFGLFIFLVFLAVIVFSELLLGHGGLKIARLSVVLLLAAGFSAFWYNPSFVRLIVLSRQGRAVISVLFNLLPLSFFIFPVLGTAGFLLFARKPFLQPLFIPLGLTIIFSLISFAGRINAALFSSYSNRYLPEISFSVCFLLGVAVTAVFDFLRLSGKIGRWKLKPSIKGKAAILFLLFIFLPLLLATFRNKPSQASLGYLKRERILGSFAHKNMVGIGEIRSRTGSFSSLLGYFITSLTIGLVGYYGVK